jgi:hypothetical protein
MLRFGKKSFVVTRDCDVAGPAVNTNDQDYIECALHQACRHDLALTLS